MRNLSIKKRRTSAVLVLTLLLTIGLCGCGAAAPSVPDTNGDGKLTCTLEIRCGTLLPRLDEMTPEKAALVPPDGVILAETELEFSPGDSVFSVLRKELKKDRIHFEYADARAFNSVYIEGIGNLYEFDCGPQSGWMYSVNGVYPSLGCSSYTLADGDVIVWSYTCDLGADLREDFANAQ